MHTRETKPKNVNISFRILEEYKDYIYIYIYFGQHTDPDSDGRLRTNLRQKRLLQFSLCEPSI